ncbi:hypothetical protein [Xanthovirga aplysinae]|uniref:hypothetical protein n=1 Tax=Xanthovirga aplysinae TaxID=2529853 RepID=UPI0012BC99D1|nr:hypothetical protein [Xanthovirga aplysinae]MTI33580.1 hypothetical protein [Xanthovirga aplysinae]
MKTSDKNLRNLLKINAIFSLLSGLVLVLFKHQVGALLTISNPQILLLIGIGLFLFAGNLLYHAFNKEIKPNSIRIIIYEDWTWVLGSAVLLILNPFETSSLGLALIGMVAFIVMTFALLQTIALNQFVTSQRGFQ